MAQGTVKWFSKKRGYGFISPDHGGGDVFVHYSDIEGARFGSLEEGERVTYEVPKAGKACRRKMSARPRKPRRWRGPVSNFAWASAGRMEDERQEIQARLSHLKNIRIFCKEPRVQARNTGSTEGEIICRGQVRTTLEDTNRQRYTTSASFSTLKDSDVSF